MFDSWQYYSTGGAPQYEPNIFVTMTTYWVPDLPDIKGFSVLPLYHKLSDRAKQNVICKQQESILQHSTTFNFIRHKSQNLKQNTSTTVDKVMSAQLTMGN